ncbi:hypothetical protein PG987_006747 [Apiospora arundinis]
MAEPEHPVDFVSFVFDAQTDYEASKPLFIDAQVPERSLNASQARSLVRSLVSGFQAEGLSKGDRVLVSATNSYLYAPLLYGIIGFGGIACGVNPSYKFEELNHLTQLFDPKTQYKKSSGKTKSPQSRIFLLDDLATPLDIICGRLNNEYKPRNEETSKFSSLLRHGESDWLTLDSEAAVKTTPALFYPTSGTSGLPKLAMLSHHNLIMQHRSIFQPPPYDAVRVLSLPCFHMFGAAWLMANPLRYGEPAYIMPRFQLETFVKNLARFGATEAYLTPPIVHMLNKSSLPVRELFRTVRWVSVGGAPIDAAALRQFQKAFLQPGATLSQCWGMTEIGTACFFAYGDDDVDLGSIKLVDPQTDCEVAAEDQVPAEAFVRSENIMMGYKGTPSPQEEGSTWFPTGDLVEVRNGKVYIVGRTKELIKTKGWQVAPAEVESVIMQHPGVRDCAVVGVPSSDGTTEVPRAYVVSKEPQGSVTGLLPASKASSITAVTSDDVYNIVASSLASYKRLEGGVVFVDAIPRTASGKTQRFKLIMAPVVGDGDNGKPTETQFSLAQAQETGRKFMSAVKQVFGA